MFPAWESKGESASIPLAKRPGDVHPLSKTPRGCQGSHIQDNHESGRGKERDKEVGRGGIQIMQYRGILIKDVVERARIRIKNWCWSSNATNVTFKGLKHPYCDKFLKNIL